MYGFLARVAISWRLMHCLNRISGVSCRLYTSKNVRLFWCIVSGVGFSYMVTSRSKILRRDIVAFYPVVGGVVGDATLYALFTCVPSVS